MPVSPSLCVCFSLSLSLSLSAQDETLTLPAGCVRVCKGTVEFQGAFSTFMMGLSVLLLQVFTPSHPICGDAFNILLTIQLWAAALAAKDMAANPAESLKANRSSAFRLEKLPRFLQAIGVLYPFVMLCLGLQGTKELVYVIPPCQWPENVEMAVAAKLTRPMPMPASYTTRFLPEVTAR